jgi:hypothetical protein
MKRIGSGSLLLIALAVVGGGLNGCDGVAVSGSAYVPVYGDYGYAGPWEPGGVEVEGGYFARPPYWHGDHFRREEEHRVVEPARVHEPAHVAPAPQPHVAPRPIPSIPNTPRPARPAPPAGGGGNERRRR